MSLIFFFFLLIFFSLFLVSTHQPDPNMLGSSETSPYTFLLCVFLVLQCHCISPPCVSVGPTFLTGSCPVPSGSSTAQRIKQIRRLYSSLRGPCFCSQYNWDCGSLHRSLSSVMRRGVPVHVLSSWYLSPSGCHPLLLLPPVTKPNPHHLLLQLQAVR